MTETPTVPVTSLRTRTAEEVRALLARRRMSATQLAKNLQVSQAYVWRRLSGETAFDIDDLERIAAVLDVPVRALLPIEIGNEPAKSVTHRYPTGPERPLRSKTAPPDNRPFGRPRKSASTLGHRATVRLPRPATATFGQPEVTNG